MPVQVRERVLVRERALVQELVQAPGRVLGQERERAPEQGLGLAPGRPSVRTQWQSTHQ